MARPRILVRTLPLDAANYGGIVQAWALQRALESIGFDPVTDTSRSFADTPNYKRRVKVALKRAILSVPGVRIERPALTAAHLRARIDADVLAFVENELETVELYGRDGADVDLLRNIDGFIVGSDQVWRARWSDIRSYLFDFLAPHDTRPRISYAASFGRDDISEYDDALREDSATLAGRLTAISVREDSGVDICADSWGVRAEVHVDPTMLLDRDRYDALTAGAKRLVHGPALVSYVLDASAPINAQIALIRERTGLGVVKLTTDAPRSVPEFRRNPTPYVRPPVQEWLRAFSDAEFVVTDSFHGTVFAILNNKSFVSIVNRSRGASRFESLLDRFGLADRLVEPGQQLPDELFANPIEWAEVNQRLADERQRGFDFLRRTLGADNSG